MASITRLLPVQVSAEVAWQAVRDVQAVHQRLCPGVLTGCQADGDARVVTFANGLVVREQIVTIDDAAMRLVYSASGGRTTHHNAVLQVRATGPGQCELLWTIDLLPDAMAAPVAALMDLGGPVMQRTLQAAGSAHRT